MRTQADTGERSRSLQGRLLVVSLGLTCVAIMFPRLLSPQFGLLDDGRTIIMARQIAEGTLDFSWDRISGRFRPTYWAIPSLIYALAGADPRWYFAANLLALVATAMLVMWLIRRQGSTRPAAWLAGMLFALSGPAVEAYYTLSKAEVPQTLFLLAGLAVAEMVPSTPTRLRCLAMSVVAASVLFIGYCAKETSLALLPISLGWWVLEVVRSRRGTGGGKLARRSVLLVGNLLASGGFLILRAAILGPSAWSEGYTFRYALDLDGLAASATRWAGWLVRDFPYLLPIAVATFSSSVSRQALLAGCGLLEAGLWLIGWVVIFLPWPWTDEYYLLPCAIGAAWMTAFMTQSLVVGWRWGPSMRRCLARALGLLSALGFVMTGPNALTSARIQLAVDEANAEMIAFLGRGLPGDATLLVNLQNPREYFDQIGIHLRELWGREDIRLRAYQGGEIAALVAGEESAFVLTARLEGEPYFTVRIGVSEVDVQRWNASLETNMEAGAQVIFETERRLERMNVEIPALLCPLVPGKAFCSEPRRLFERETFVYGWRLYALRER